MRPWRERGTASPFVVVGTAIVAGLAAVAMLAPVLAPYDPRALAGDSLQAPSGRHFLGTNDIGQDVLSQLIWGARASLVVAVTTAAMAVTGGALVGLAAGLVGGWADTFTMRVVDVVLAFPRLPLLVLVAALAGASRVSVIVVMTFLTWPVIARLVRSQALSLRQRGFVHAAQGFGAGVGYVIRRHLVPAVGPLLAAGFVAVAANAVLLEASLAFLGLSDPTAVSWGLIINRALAHPGLYFSAAWAWWLVPAGVAIALAVLGFSLLGLGLEPALNPRWRRAS